MHAKMGKQVCFSFSLLLVCFSHYNTSLGQLAQVPALPAVAPAKPADAPASTPTPPGPPDVTKIFQKAGGFTILIRLLKRTAVADQIRGQPNDTKNGFTLFAPTDAAFSNLKSGTLNSLSDEQKIRLIQFHTLPTYYSLANFQTVSNPSRTQAGDTNPVSGTVYLDNHLAIYQVDKVLLPLDIFVAKPPVLAPAPAPTKPKAKKTTAGSQESSTTTTTPTVVDFDAVRFTEQGVFVSVGVSVLVAALSML
ncbi:hypothetical protein I3843_13G096000 [Carya illinoinensis]|uniref:FAS1 domain-containing protein n=1 Tax=Carya illinoinensis TaxID=32201 RepID=A0A8T1NSL2_CARIL|nr:hypothetical protein CIPAW_13G110400 [Carya illinoinensis]KAG6681829.1 hypothetical protein I3842_13G109500 [Carya illinoinensis]KAG7950117.1 hypothetical protein I3843_13G096000 [Carya illinoinensis]